MVGYRRDCLVGKLLAGCERELRPDAFVEGGSTPFPPFYLSPTTQEGLVDAALGGTPGSR